HRPQHRPRARRRARPRAGRRARPRRRALHPRSPARQPLARRDRPAARGGDRALRAPAAPAVRPRLVRRCLHRSGGAAHGRADGTPEHPIARQLATAVRQFGRPRAALEAIVEGCEMDLQRSTYETFEDLAPYCYRVASAVGLCCIEIFGYTDPRAREYAVSLGMALQLTNIIRDVGADARSGRIY